MPCEAVIRPLFLDDAPILQRISAEARERYRSIPALAHVADTPPVALERFEAGSGWLAESDGKILGYALSKPVDSLLFLDNISTRAQFRGMGVGARLLERVLTETSQDGFDTVAITTFRLPPWNGPWFRRFGFVPIPEAAIGTQLAAIIKSQGTYLDPDQREALSRRVSAVGE